MCFGIDFPKSLNNILKKWYPEAQHYCPNVPIILVGNKMDLRNDPYPGIEPRPAVTFEDGQAMAEKIGAFSYLECSAKNNEKVREVFESATRAALQDDVNRNKILRTKNRFANWLRRKKKSFKRLQRICRL